MKDLHRTYSVTNNWKKKQIILEKVTPRGKKNIIQYITRQKLFTCL